jgi:FlaG/FlaF family flagellin (archaellin)
MKAIIQQLKRFSDDERGVSPVVGFVLMFALVMIVFTLYQSSVVPAQNEEVEFKHSQTVEGEMSELNDAIQQAGTSGVPQSATIATGVQYPDRALAINPGSPVGSLSTSAKKNVEITGLSDGSGYWSSDSRDPFETRLVSYQSNYNLFQQETEFTLENGMIGKNFENGNSLVKSDGALISNNGKQINLVLVGGEYQKHAITSSVTATPVSTSTEYHQLESNGGTIKVPTSLSQEIWQNEIVDGAAGIQSVTVSGGVATLNLKDRKYKLRLTKVSLGTSSEPSATYLKSEDPSGPSEPIDATVGESETLSVSVRDEFGNPYASDDVTISANTTGAGNLTPTGGVSPNEEGRATFTYEPTDEDADNSPVEVKLSINDRSEDYETITYELDVSDDSASSNPNDIGGDIDNGYALDPSRRVTIDSATASGGSIDFAFNNRGDTDMTVTRIQFSGYAGHFPSSSFATDGRFAGTDVELNGQTVLLNTPFTVTADGMTTATLSDLDVNKVQTGLLIISVKYQYTEDGATKAETATYSVPVLK